MKVLAVMAALLALSVPGPAAAGGGFGRPGEEPSALPPPAREVDIDEHLGRALDRGLAFTDSRGRRFVLGDALPGDRPVLLVLAYYRCPMLCGLVLRGVVEGLNQLSFRLGEQYRVLTVSFDPRDTPDGARQKRQSVLAGLGRSPADPGAWPFLIGDEPTIHRLADDLGFRFAYDPRTEQYAHPAAIFALTPDGRVSRYLYGVEFSPRDLRLALLEAGEGKIGTIVDRVILTCYRYDQASRAYAPFVFGFMRLGGGLILASLAVLFALLLRGERRRRAAAGRGGAP